MACLHRADGDVLDPSLVTVPVVLGVGTQSRPHHRENALRLPELIEHAELVEVEGSGHGCHISHPDQFAAMVRRAIALADC
jgi:pimeloyl-ACP methyl ester carboxylesterase